MLGAVGSTAMSGYSGTPLPRKLGIKPGHRVLLAGAPDGFREDTLGELPEGVTVRTRASGEADVIVAFHTRRAELAKRMPVLRERMEPAAGLWIAWPKRAAKVETDLTEDVVRELAYANTLVDNKVCAIDEVVERPPARDPAEGPLTSGRAAGAAASRPA